MKKIGAITPIWNQEIFLKPHFDMLSSLDKHVVMIQPAPLGQYQQEHGIGEKPDRSEQLIKEMYPNVEIHYGRGHKEFNEELYNEILAYVQDMDIVFRLDVDMFFTEEDWNKLLEYIQMVDADAFLMNFKRNSINYYADYDHGAMDAEEFDPIAFNPKYPLEWRSGLIAGGDMHNIISIDKWMCHHCRGWNKPKSIGKDWVKDHEEWVKKYNGWHKMPEEIRTKLELWQKQLKK